MSTQHTPGKLKVQHPHAGERGWEVTFEPGIEQVCKDVTEENARRLVAAWNACEGIETYALELMTGDNSIKEQITATGKQRPKPATHRAIVYRQQRDELLVALKEIVTQHGNWNNGIWVANIARAAIAKYEESK